MQFIPGNIAVHIAVLCRGGSGFASVFLDTGASGEDDHVAGAIGDRASIAHDPAGAMIIGVSVGPVFRRGFALYFSSLPANSKLFGGFVRNSHSPHSFRPSTVQVILA